jgi:hypothetical protein
MLSTAAEIVVSLLRVIMQQVSKQEEGKRGGGEEGSGVAGLARVWDAESSFNPEPSATALLDAASRRGENGGGDAGRGDGTVPSDPTVPCNL